MAGTKSFVGTGLSVEVGFTSGVWSSPFFWTDITRHVMSIPQISMGRQHELQQVNPSTAQISLDNQLGGNKGWFSPWNPDTPYFNLLNNDDSLGLDTNWFTTSAGTNGNQSTQVLYGNTAGFLTGTSGGPSQFILAPGIYAVSPSTHYTFSVWMRAATVGESLSVGIVWYNGASAISTITSTPITDSTSAWTQYVISGTSPSNANNVQLNINDSASTTHSHYFTAAMLALNTASVPIGWTLGQTSPCVPGRPVRITQTISATTYNVFYGYAQSWVPTYGQSRSTITLNCYDGMALLALPYMDVNLYSPQIITDGATAYWECQDPVGSSTFADSTGNGHTATLSGAATFGGTTGALQAVADSCVTFAANGVMVSPITTSSGAHVMFDGWFKTPDAGQTLMSWAVGETAGNEFGVSLCTNVDGQATLCGGALTTSLPSLFTLVTGETFIADGNWHYYAVSVPVTDSSGTYTLYVDGVLIGSGANVGYTWTSATGETFLAGGYWQDYNFTITLPTPGFNGSMDQIAYYATPLTASQIANHYALGSAGFVVQDSGARTSVVLEDLAGLPSGLLSIATGVVNVQGATGALNTTTAASYLQQVVNTERGILYQDATGVLQFKNRWHVYANSASVNSQFTFTYDGTGQYYIPQNLIPQEDDADLWNDVNVQRQGGILQNANDSTSITKFGRRSLQGYTSLLFEYDSDAQDLAQGLLYQYKEPQARVRAIKTSSTLNNQSVLPHVLALNLLDRITIVWKPLDGSSVQFNQQSLVEQVQHTITPGSWDTTLAVTPIGTEVFATWGTGLWGTGTWGF